MRNLNPVFKTYIDIAKENINDVVVIKEDSNKQELRSFENDICIYENIDKLDNYFKYTNYFNTHINKLNSLYNANFEDYQKFVRSLSSVTERNISMSKLLDYLSSNYEEIHKRVLEAVNVSDVEGSSQSLLHLIKFWPLINKYPNTYICIEPITQLWSMIYKAPNKGTLSFVVSDNGEIRFSFIKQGKGLSKFTGRARISKKIQDYRHIRLLFEMMSLD